MLMTMTRHHIIHMMIPHQLLPQKNKQPTKSFFDELIQDCMASTSTFNDTESLIDEYLSTPCLQQEEDPLVYWKTNKERFSCIAEIIARY